MYKALQLHVQGGYSTCSVHGCWGWTLSVLTAFVAFIEHWGRAFVVVTAFVALFYGALGWIIGCLWCLKHLQGL